MSEAEPGFFVPDEFELNTKIANEGVIVLAPVPSFGRTANTRG
jgi:hypothetical protein